MDISYINTNKGLGAMSIGSFIEEMLVLYTIALVGFFMRRFGVLDDRANHVFTQLLLYITLPALILFSLDIPFSVAMVKDFMWLLSMSIYILTCTVVIAFWAGKRSTLSIGRKNVYEGLIIFGNQGFIGYAISYILLGDQGIVYVTLFNLCYLILIWTYGIFLFSKVMDKVNWKFIFFNPGIVSTILGLFVFLLPVRLPVLLSKGLDSVGSMTVPLSMMLIGCLLGNVRYKELFAFIKDTYLWKATFLRLIGIPLLLLPFLFLSVPYPLFLIAVVVSGMPAASTVSLYAQKYGADSFYASVGVLKTSLLCIVTIPILYMVVQLFY